MQRDLIVGQLRMARPRFEAEGVRNVAVFGSRSRGDFRPDSDLDILLEVTPESRFSLMGLVGAEMIASEATGLEANAFMRRSLEPVFAESIRDDVVEVF
jgi:uncharacterized protein